MGNPADGSGRRAGDVEKRGTSSMRLQPTASFAILSGLWLALGIASAARAEDKPVAWTDTLKFSGYVEAGITGNPDSPADGINFGHLFTDRANTPLLNQFSLIA